MRKLSLVALVAGFCLCFTSVANATSVNLAFTGATAGVTGVGTDTVTLGIGVTATLSLDIQMNADSRGVSNAVFSVKFDTDLGNELDIIPPVQEISWTNQSGMRTLGPVNPGITSSQESTLAVEGQAFSFEGITTGSGPKSTTLTFARIVFRTTANAGTDGPDIFASNYQPAIDGMFTDGGVDILAEVFPGATPTTVGTPVSATVNVIPEPGTFALLGLGIGALVVAGRRKS